MASTTTASGGSNHVRTDQTSQRALALCGPLLTKPTNEDDYDALVEALDELLGMVGDDEAHPLASLASHVGDMLEAYDEASGPCPKGVESRSCVT